MPTGIVTWVDASENHGFITPDGGGADLFVDPSDSSPLVVGATAEFETRHAPRGRLVAENVVVRAAAPDDPEHGQDGSGWRARR